MKLNTVLLTLMFFGQYFLMFSQNQISPDGTKIVYYQKVDSINTDIFISNLDGSNKTKITDHPYSDYNPEWLANGKEITFYRKHPGKDQAMIFVISINDLSTRQITDSIHYNADPSFHPSTRYFAYNSNQDGDYEIYTSVVQKNISTQLTFNDKNDWTPDWSPNGDELCFVSNRTGAYEIFRMNADGTSQSQMTNSGTENYCPDWSPDGKHIAYFRRDGQNEKFDIYIIDTENKRVLNLTQTDDWNEFIIGWSKDSRKVIFSCEKQNGICSIDLDSGKIKVLMQH